MRHLIDPLDFSVEEIDALLDLAGEIEQKRPVLHSSIIASAFLEPIKPFSHREAGFPAARFRFCFSFGSLESRFSENNRKGQRKGLRKGQKSVAFFLLLWYSKD